VRGDLISIVGKEKPNAVGAKVTSDGTKVPIESPDGIHGNNVPIRTDAGEHTMVTMSMYVELLSSALDHWVDDLSDDALVDYALLCRAEMLSSGFSHAASACALLATEIAYDRALMNLCMARGIEVVATSFAYPREERTRLEWELSRAGLDLAELAQTSTAKAKASHLTTVVS
jgi:hypothetical protein